MIRSLWASVQNDPVVMRKINGWLTIIWFIEVKQEQQEDQ